MKNVEVRYWGKKNKYLLNFTENRFEIEELKKNLFQTSFVG